MGKDVMKELLKIGSGAISFVLIERLCLQAESSLVFKHRCANMQKKIIQANHLCKELLAAVTSCSWAGLQEETSTGDPGAQVASPE